MWLKAPPEKVAVITDVVQTLHTASLLYVTVTTHLWFAKLLTSRRIDDVEDDSTLRRGFPVAHDIFGMAQTVNSANYMYFQALSKISALGSQDAVDICIDELLNLHRGQGLEIFWRETLSCPSEAEYTGMVYNKTAGLFRLAVRLLQSAGATNM